MTTPAACVEAWRGSPSRAIDRSSTCFTSGSFSYLLLSSGLTSRALAIVMPSSFGMALAISSPSAYDASRALATSRTAALALRVPKVMICETLSLPYFLLTYSMTSCLLSMQKSTSISGMLTLSGFRNLSKIRLYLIGSISVISRLYATMLPAAEPLPGPTAILCDLA